MGFKKSKLFIIKKETMKKLSKQQINEMAYKAKISEPHFQELYIHMANFFEAHFKTLYQSKHFIYRQYLDDLKNELYILFPTIIKNFDANASKKGYEVDFRTYILWYFKKLCNATMQYMKSDQPHHFSIHHETTKYELDAPLGLDKPIVEAAMADDDYLLFEQKNEADRKIKFALEILNEKEKFIYVQKVVQEKTYDELTHILFKKKLTKTLYTQEAVRQIFLKIQKKISKRIGK